MYSTQRVVSFKGKKEPKGSFLVRLFIFYDLSGNRVFI
ncbi:hypothetical protein ECDEC13E_3049 [Escherichia coli DEC13E]|nr:hypothetical protein ECDEC13E_3049 [Escherichia coli DEC13E]